jgi:hypothetical protein
MANTAATQVSIGNDQTLNAAAARYWLALVARIKAETGMVILPTEGTRQYARQKYLWDGYRAGAIDPSTGRRFNPAWSPDDSRAYHLSGRAVDVGSGVGYVTTTASRIFYALAGLYGFRPTVAGEPWHFEWRADWVGISLEAAAITKAVIPEPPSEEDDMRFTLIAGRQTGWKFPYILDAEDGKRRALSKLELDIYRSRKNRYDEVGDVDQVGFDAIPKKVGSA